jgi:hypothetical protein
VPLPACSLAATVDRGRSVQLTGSGFAAGAEVTIGVQRNGDTQPSIHVSADAAGGLAVSVDAGPGLGGAYSFSATAGTCTATATAVAVETAGGGGGTAPSPVPGTAGGSGATLPPTDTSALMERSDGSREGAPPLPVAPLLVAAGGALAAARLAATELGRGRRTLRRR